MRQVVLVLFFTLSFLSGLFANETCSITGNILDHNNEALPYATVLLKNISNNYSQGTTTDDNGYFCFSDLNKGNYQLSVSYIGFSGFQSDDIKLEFDDKYELQDIRLKSEGNDLSEVIVTGKANVSEIKPTYIKYKTSALISQAGGNAGDILKNMPSVAMGGSPGHNRDIRFRGLGNAYTKVLINGRETGLKGNNRESILDQIPASSIKHIEILSVPGVEYQSEGINGIVNIVLKENQNFGTKGSAEILAGNQDGISGGFNLSHKTEKLNLFGQYDFQRRKLTKDKTKTKTSYKEDEISGIEKSIELEEKRFNNQSLRMGFDYYLLPKTKFSAEYIYGSQLEDKDKLNDITKYKADNTFKSASQELKTEYKPSNYHQALSSFNHTFNNNQQFTAGFSYLKSQQDKLEEKRVDKMDENGNWIDFQPKLENKNELKEGKEYTWDASFKNFKFNSHNLKFGYAGKSETANFSVIQDKYSYKDTTWSSSSSGNDNFSVNEVTHALYVSDEYHYAFIRANAGFRYEFTQLKTNADNGLNEGTGNYGIFLPNIALTANIDETQYLTLNLGRRIRRPGFKDLNPFEEEKDPGFFKKGNPDLVPEKAWAYELGYLKNFKNFNVGANLFYRDINDVIQKTISEDDQGIITEQPQNTGHAWLAGVEFMTSINPFEFWQLNASYSIFESEITSGEYEGDALKDQYKWSAKAINDFKLPYKTNLQLSFNAVGPKVSTTKEENTIWFADLGIEKELIKDATLIVKVSDIFDSLAKEKTELTDKSSTYEYENTLGRIFMVGIKYRF